MNCGNVKNFIKVLNHDVATAIAKISIQTLRNPKNRDSYRRLTDNASNADGKLSGKNLPLYVGDSSNLGGEIKMRPIIYVSTNEESASVLEALKNAGFLIYSDLVSDDKYLQKLSSVDRFMFELLLMIYCDHFIYWGISSIHQFVNHARKNRLELV